MSVRLRLSFAHASNYYTIIIINLLNIVIIINLLNIVIIIILIIIAAIEDGY